MSPKTPIQQLDPETLQIVGTHASISDAARALGMVPSAINMAVNKGFVSGGYRWRPIPEADLPPRGPPVYKRTAAPVVKRAAAPPPLPAAASVSGSSQGRVLMKKPAMFREDVDEPMVRAPQVVKKPAMFKEMVEEDEEDAAKRQRMCLGEMAAAAAEQWNLDEDAVIAWATQRGLPGVGFADLLQYRREHPEEDLVAGMCDAELSAGR